MSDSLKKIASQIQYALSFIIEEEMPGEFISLTKVDLSPDLEYCDILVSVLNDDSAKVDKLNHASKSLRMELAKKLDLRRTPLLRFHFDGSDMALDKINSLLKDV